MTPLIIYNLFPTLVGPPERWVPHAERARAMGFNWIYLNPWHCPGFSGSLYAVKEHWRLHPLLVSPGRRGDDLGGLAEAVHRLQGMGLGVMMDLVVNHVSKDSPLVREHPGWFRRGPDGEPLSPSVVDPADPRKVTVWGDLAEVDNAEAADREGLWRYWEGLVRGARELGFTGFRCDAAYKVPAALWRRLVTAARAAVPGVVFVAETLGCSVPEVKALRDAGFDYLYNSSKWWDFRAPWCLEQHEEFRALAPSISFPESHDTERLARESGGSAAVQRQRYAFAAAFSAGLQATIGYEYGFQRRLDVVRTRPTDWEDPLFDLSAFVTRVNALKAEHPLLAGEGVLCRLPDPGDGVVALERWSDEVGTRRGVILVNTDRDVARAAALPAEAGRDWRLYRVCRDDAPAGGAAMTSALTLDPAEVVLVMEPLP